MYSRAVQIVAGLVDKPRWGVRDVLCSKETSEGDRDQSESSPAWGWEMGRAAKRAYGAAGHHPLIAAKRVDSWNRVGGEAADDDNAGRPRRCVGTRGRQVAVVEGGWRWRREKARVTG